MAVGFLVMHAVVLVFLFKVCVLSVQCNIQMIKTDDDIWRDNQIKQNNTNCRFNKANRYNVSQTFSNSRNATYCNLNLQKDLPKANKPQPLYINTKTNQIWEPNAEGYLKIPSGAIIELYCSASFANATTTTDSDQTEVIERFIPKNTRTLKPRCIADKLFMWQGQRYEFEQFVCNKPLDYAVERLDEQCAQQTAQMFRVGFNITQQRFLETMRICYDTATLRNHYTVYRLLPASAHFQRHVKRLSFSGAGYFDGRSLNFYYTRRNQWQRALELYGNNETVAKIFNDKDLFLARGHLAAKADFIYANQQRTTFTLLNVAPQWQSFNAGQWAALEDGVRKFLLQRKLEVLCYTGTWGTLILQPPNVAEVAAMPLNLAKDANNNDILPVPQLYYRVIVERQNPRRGIALVGVNNPHATLNEILRDYVICEDIKDTVAWLRWMRNSNLAKGYIYVCNVADFFEATNILPAYLNATNEILS